MYIELNSLFTNEEDYMKIRKDLTLNNFIVYPVYLTKQYFLSDKVLGLIKQNNVTLYNNIYKNINKNKILEIKII